MPPETTPVTPPSGPPRRLDPATARRYWRANISLVAVLLVIWAVASLLLGVVLVEPLNKLHVGGAPLGFWISQQGAIYVFVALILVYVLAMRRLDRRFGVRED